MAHTTYCMKVEAASGHRMVLQGGTFAYLSTSSKTARITVGFHKLVMAMVGSNQTLGGTKTAMLGNQVSYVGSAQITQQLDRVVVVARKTGTIKGVYSYMFLGY